MPGRRPSQLERSTLTLLSAALLLCAVSAQGSQPALGDDGKTTWTGRPRADNTLVMGDQLFMEEGLHTFATVTQQFLEGRFQLAGPTPKNEPKKELKLACLNSVAPPPLNWKMWCPGKDARVVRWVDSAGATHHEMLLRPQRNLTATQAVWFMSSYTMGMLPPIVEFQGKSYYFYHLWHPLDHVDEGIKLAPSAAPGNIAGLGIYTLVHERYRPLPGDKSGRRYESNSWFVAYDPVDNLMKNRFVVGINILGIQVWTLKVEFIDTKEGMAVSVELVVGSPPKGWDPLEYSYGNLLAALWNDALVGPLLARTRNSADWEGSFAAIIRHMVEEFGNMQFFVPELWDKYSPLAPLGLKHVPSLDTFMRALNKTRADGPTLNFYTKLSAIASQAPRVNATGHKAAAAAVSVAQGVQAAIAANPQRASNSSATPAGRIQAPKLKAAAAASDAARISVKG